MAVFSVANMVQFNEAILNVASGDTIEIMADLDWNEVVNDYTETTNLGNVTTTALTNITINGNDHNIYNMTGNLIRAQTYGTAIYNFHGSEVTLNDISFLNCDFSLKDTCIAYSGGSNTNITINKCVFQGAFKYSFFKKSGGNITLNSCMITCNKSDYSPFKTVSGHQAPDAYNYCWIRLTGYNAYNAGNGSTYAENLNGCYIEGKLNYVSSSNTPRIFRYVQNSCINLEFNSYQTTNIDALIVPTTGTTQKNIINIDKISAYSETYKLTEQNSTNINKCCTDEHTKDAEYLASVGFDIIP